MATPRERFEEYRRMLAEYEYAKRKLRREIITLILFLVGFGLLWSIDFKLALGVYVAMTAFGREIKDAST